MGKKRKEVWSAGSSRFERELRNLKCAVKFKDSIAEEDKGGKGVEGLDQ